MAEKKKGFDLAAKLDNVPNVSESHTPEPTKGYLAFTYADIESIHPDPYNTKSFTLSDLEGMMDLIILEGGLHSMWCQRVRLGRSSLVTDGMRRCRLW